MRNLWKFNCIEVCLSIYQKENQEDDFKRDTLDMAVLTAERQITMLEATCKELQADNTLLKSRVNAPLNIIIVGIKEGAENSHTTDSVSHLCNPHGY